MTPENPGDTDPNTREATAEWAGQLHPQWVHFAVILSACSPPPANANTALSLHL